MREQAEIETITELSKQFTEVLVDFIQRNTPGQDGDTKTNVALTSMAFAMGCLSDELIVKMEDKKQFAIETAKLLMNIYSASASL